MTLVPLTTCCLSLGVDPKTLRLWLSAAQLSCCPHPSDARLKCLTLVQLQHLAQLHGRPLLSGEAASASQVVPAGLSEASPEASAVFAGADETALSLQLANLQRQVTTLQAQVTELALALLALHSSQDGASPSAPLAAPTLLQGPTPPTGSGPADLPDSAPLTTAPAASRPRRRSRALPLIQVRPDGSVVVIAPTEGILALVPDSPEWFAWLASIEAFSFESPMGRFTATRKFRSGQRIQTWTVHCSLHGRSCGLYLGMTPTLTLARLQEMVAAVRTRLSTP